MTKSILLCGVGGQGTVKASRIIALSGMEAGLYARTAETIGMAQRGGSVVSHVRISDSPIASPMIPKHTADVLIAFEPGEAVRCIDYLKDDGVVIVNNKAVKPVTASLSGSDYDGSDAIKYLQDNFSHVSLIDGDLICEKCGSDKVLNIALLAGAAASGELGITVEGLKCAIRKQLPEKTHEMNFKAVDYVNGLLKQEA
ncbi:MAG: pyruvate ferredoxin oxidoreductase [Lachnospiraceae bacterium]|uniref:Pyruvate ferredoxin oxidoreductase n=1 Tax=Candidatus Weimeria bifida TaxID=2599074 RepID=A0A6N7IZB1_9FIRM|nr:pyruvate ferredoxin oxidoreductase [Candidatus Weimeria bifida]RRF95445.1 MAG: pyruvate ferredoxin oxidoreductase [Lachnospiraceae bacterium]